MTKALTTHQSVLAQYTDEEKQVIRDVIAKGVNDTELLFFLTACQKYKLDPIRRQIHAVKRWDTKQNREVMSIQVGVDGLRAIAARTNEYAGNDDPVFDSESQRPTKATVTVYRLVKGDRMPFTATARWDEYYPGEKMGFMWKKMPHVMLGKCAEALALRKAFPEASELYIDEEMQQADRLPDNVQSADQLIATIDACKTKDELDALATSIAAQMGSLSPDDQKRVKEAGRKKRQTVSAVDAEIVENDGADEAQAKAEYEDIMQSEKEAEESDKSNSQPHE